MSTAEWLGFISFGMMMFAGGILIVFMFGVTDE